MIAGWWFRFGPLFCVIFDPVETHPSAERRNGQHENMYINVRALVAHLHIFP